MITSPTYRTHHRLPGPAAAPAAQARRAVPASRGSPQGRPPGGAGQPARWQVTGLPGQKPAATARTWRAS
jgi:hypothetical protein